MPLLLKCKLSGEAIYGRVSGHNMASQMRSGDVTHIINGIYTSSADQEADGWLLADYSLWAVV